MDKNYWKSRHWVYGQIENDQIILASALQSSRPHLKWYCVAFCGLVRDQKGLCLLLNCSLKQIDEVLIAHAWRIGFIARVLRPRKFCYVTLHISKVLNPVSVFLETGVLARLTSVSLGPVVQEHRFMEKIPKNELVLDKESWMFFHSSGPRNRNPIAAKWSLR